MRLQRLNVINKEIKPFEKEFYNSLNLTNLPQGDLQLIGGGDCPGGKLAQGAIVRGAIGIGGNCPGGDCLGGNWHGGVIILGAISWWVQRLNVINKEIKPFEKEFYNSLNLTNLPQGDLQLNGGGNCPGGYCPGGN